MTGQQRTSLHGGVCLLRINGMTCAGCARSIERALRRLPAVVDASVNLATATAEVRFASDADIAAEDLIEAVRQAGYQAEVVSADDALTAVTARGGPAAARQVRRLVIAAVLTGAVLLLEYGGRLVAVSDAFRTLARPLELVLTVALVGFCGQDILRTALSAVRHATANMEVLISLGMLVAVGAGAAGVFWPAGPFGRQTHFPAAALILTIVLAGKYLEARAKGRTGAAVAALIRRAPRTAYLVRDGRIDQVPVEQVSTGDIVQVAAEQFVPVDGVVVDGEAAIDESMLTGESTPVERSCGEKVFGGTLVRSGVIKVRAEAVGADTALARIIRLVQAAQAGRTRIQRLADRVAAVFVPLVVAAAAATFAGWIAYSGTDALPEALSRAVAVLVVACPCALGLATPTAVVAATGVAALRGILVREPAALEATGSVDVVVFDKTGTLTTGKMELAEFVCDPVGCGKLSETEVLQLAASAEQFSEHPLARALVEGARTKGVTPVEPGSYEAFAGLGVRAVIRGHTVLVGSPRWMRQQNVDISSAARTIEHLTSLGQTPVVVVVDGRVAAVAGLADRIRPRAAEAVEALKRQGIEVAMVTGDSERVAAVVAAELGVQIVRAEVPPEGKVEEVERFRQSGRRVAMVGDGVNDAPALAAADVGIAFAAGSDVACEAADIALVGDSPMLVADAIRLSRFALRVIKQNLFWAFFYNMAALPLAAMGVLPPAVAAAAMMLSSLTVVGNALRLYRWAPAGAL